MQGAVIRHVPLGGALARLSGWQGEQQGPDGSLHLLGAAGDWVIFFDFSFALADSERD